MTQVSDDATMATKSGVDIVLEAQANLILAEDRRVNGPLEEGDWLSERQLRTARSHEVYTYAGQPDPHVMCGLYGRAYNPHLTKRPRRSTSHDD